MNRVEPSRGMRLAAVALALCCAGCQVMGGRANAGDTDGEEAEEIATPVVVSTVQAGEITASISAASTIRAEQQVTVHAESTGRITQLSVEEGDLVKGGKLLARIKADMQAAGVDRASAALDKAKADLDTVESLFARKVASKEELDAARLAYKTALLDVRDRRRDVRNTRVTAPFSGTITERFVTKGGFVTSGAQLFSITDLTTLIAVVYVPEKELDRIRVGQPADVAGKAARARKGTGTVKRIAPVVDETTGTVKVTVGLPAGKSAFLPGMYAEVTLTTERRERAMLVDKEAVITDDDQAFVFVATEDRAHRTKIELGLTDDARVEVLSGLELGQEVIVAGHAGLKHEGLIRRVDPSGEPVDSAQPDAVGIAERATPSNKGT